VNGDIVAQLEDVQDIDDILVYIGFMPPGKSDFVVRYQSSGESEESEAGTDQLETEREQDSQPNISKKRAPELSLATQDDKDDTPSQADLAQSRDMNLKVQRIKNEQSKENYSARALFYHGRALVDIRTEDIHHGAEDALRAAPDSDHPGGPGASTLPHLNRKPTHIGAVPFSKEQSVFSEYPDPEDKRLISRCWDHDRFHLSKAFRNLEKTRIKAMYDRGRRGATTSKRNE